MSEIEWVERLAWVAVFDFLGFKEIARKADSRFHQGLLTSKLRAILKVIDKQCNDSQGKEYIQISDTLVFYTYERDIKYYPQILRCCKDVINESIKVRLPLRGALSHGTAIVEQERPIVLGPGFVEAYDYCEGQDWIGFLLTPSAVDAVRRADLEPIRHGFISESLPLKRGLDSENVLAYRFQDGATNRKNPLLNYLCEMKAFAPDKDKPKYSRTISFIIHHHEYPPSRGS